jgi:hypothetical protein
VERHQKARSLGEAHARVREVGSLRGVVRDWQNSSIVWPLSFFLISFK